MMQFSFKIQHIADSMDAVPTSILTGFVGT